MADPRLIRAGIAANLDPLDINQISAYVLDSPSPPCAYVRSGPVEYDLTYGRGYDTWTFIVYVLVGYVHDISAQMELDKMLMSHGPSSVKTLLESDRSLGGVVGDNALSVPSVTGARAYTLEGQSARVLGAEWTVQVIASGKE